MAFFAGALLLFVTFSIAFSFLAIDLLGIIFFMGTGGLQQVTLQIFSALSGSSIANIAMLGTTLLPEPWPLWLSPCAMAGCT